MLLPEILFYLFAAVLVLAAGMVVIAKNPVHSVLFLILAFFNAGGLFLLLGAEFVAFILVIVYVGAVAVLFLFVVMMLDVDFKDLRRGVGKALPVGLLVGAVLLAQLAMTAFSWQALPHAGQNILNPTPATITNTKALGMVLYTDYVYPFQVCGLILLVAMVGAISLTLRSRPGVYRQKAAAQMNRTQAQSMKIVKVATGQGIGEA